MAISTNLISGLSSGFDWRSMIDQLIAIEHKSVDLMAETQADFEAKYSQWQSVNTQLLSLKTSAESLKDPDDWYVYTSSMTTDSATVYAAVIVSDCAHGNLLDTVRIEITNTRDRAAEEVAIAECTRKIPAAVRHFLKIENCAICS